MQVLDPIDLPALLGRFHAEHPDVELRLRQSGVTPLFEDVRTGALDLALVALPHGDSPGLDAAVLADEPMSSLLELVAAGLGVSVVPPWAAGFRLPIALVPLRERAPRWTLGVVTRAGQRPSAAGRALIDLLPQARREPG